MGDEGLSHFCLFLALESLNNSSFIKGTRLLTNLEIKKCLYIVLILLLAMVGLVGLAALGLDIPVFRQVVGFIFLTFVPGILILRILRVHNISISEGLVYLVGLSVAFIMFLGFFMNMLYPFFGISKPISVYPLIITISVVVLILCACPGLPRYGQRRFAGNSGPKILGF